jgi:hypothetical protein
MWTEVLPNVQTKIEDEIIETVTGILGQRCRSLKGYCGCGVDSINSLD